MTHRSRLAALLAVALALGSSAALAQQRRAAAIPSTVEVLRDLEFGTGGGRPLLLDLYRPKSKGDSPRPAVVCVHGGGWSKGDKAQVFGALSLVARGFVVISVNYRLSGEAPFPAAVEDCKCAVRWLRAHAAEYGVDPERVGVWGSSAGGQLALMVACADGFEGKGGWADQSSRVQAVCSWFGPTDLRVADRPPYRWLGGGPQDVPDTYAQASPLTHVSADDPPAFLAHGDQDRVVPLDQSEALQAALKKAGVPCDLLVVENGGHGFKPMDGKSPSLGLGEVEDRSAEWFVRVLK